MPGGPSFYDAPANPYGQKTGPDVKGQVDQHRSEVYLPGHLEGLESQAGKGGETTQHRNEKKESQVSVEQIAGVERRAWGV